MHIYAWGTGYSINESYNPKVPEHHQVRNPVGPERNPLHRGSQAKPLSPLRGPNVRKPVSESEMPMPIVSYIHSNL